MNEKKRCPAGREDEDAKKAMAEIEKRISDGMRFVRVGQFMMVVCGIGLVGVIAYIVITGISMWRS